mmetsp:Transcript_3673/g.9948  ORF Transcript_3673/g.9948 Transcript_3673/m.9948 type:complete len:203 (-) Transcript_3673:160-768(-)
MSSLRAGKSSNPSCVQSDSIAGSYVQSIASRTCTHTRPRLKHCDYVLLICSEGSLQRPCRSAAQGPPPAQLLGIPQNDSINGRRQQFACPRPIFQMAWRVAVFSQNAKGHAFGDVICTNGAILKSHKQSETPSSRGEAASRSSSPSCLKLAYPVGFQIETVHIAQVICASQMLRFVIIGHSSETLGTQPLVYFACRLSKHAN